MMKKTGLAALAFVFGCIGGAQGPVGTYRLELSREIMGVVFGDELLPSAAPTGPRRKFFLQVEVDRLKTAGWREGEIALIDYGKDAIPPLIELLDNREEAMAVIQPLGKAVKTRSLTYNVGEVAHHVLMDIVGHYSDYRGELPPLDKGAWEEWWRRNERRITFRSD